MSAAAAVWTASALGALLFFVGGCLAARARGSRAPLDAPAERDRLAQLAAQHAELAAELEASRANNRALREQAQRVHELDTMGREQRRLEAELATARQAVERLGAEVQRHRAGLQRAIADRDAARAAQQRAEVERDAARAALARVEAERDAASSTRAEVAAVSAERDRLQRELAAALDQRQEAARARTILERQLAEAAQLMRDNDELRARLDEAEGRAADAARAQAAEAARQELLMEMEVLRSRLEELDQLREENLGLRQVAAEREALQQQLTELGREVAALRAEGLARARRPAVPASAPTTGSRGTEQTLQALLNGIASSPGMRCAVLADELGLPIVSIGEHAGPLAAFGGFMDTIAAKTSAFLPMEGIQRVQVQDEHGVTVSAFPLAIDDSRIALVTLTVDSVPTTQQMTRLLRSAATMVQ